MRKKIKRIIVGSVALFLASIAFVFRPYAKPDPANVAPALAALQEPIKKVHTVYYLDGGSYGIRIVDRNDSRLDLCVPAPLGQKDDQYRRVFIGSLHYTEPGAVEVVDPYDTKLRLEEIMRSSSGFDRRRDVAIAYLSGRWRDFWKVILRAYIVHAYKEEDA